MKAMKDVIYAGLSEVFGADKVSDEYPYQWKSGTAVQLTEEQNKVLEYDSTAGETKSYLRYRIDVYGDKNTSPDVLKVNKVLAGIGFKRTDCMDVPSPGLHHKLMRYEAIYDLENDVLYWE